MHKISHFCRVLFRRRVAWDRRLAQGRFSTILYIMGGVLCIPLFCWVIILLLAVLGICDTGHLFSEEALAQDRPGVLWLILYHFIDPGNQLMTLGWERIVAFILALCGCIFMNGIMVSAIVGWYDRHVDKWKYGQARYAETLKRSRFIVIIGAHEAVPGIIRQLFAREPDLDYVVVQTRQNVETLRNLLVSFLSTEEESKVILYAGDRTAEDDIRELHPEKAMEVLIIGDSSEEEARESNHDALNLSCLRTIAGILSRSEARDRKLTCRVMFEYQTSFSIFQYSDISQEIRQVIDFKSVNFYELWAQRVFVNPKLEFHREELAGYLPLEGEHPIGADSEETVHLVIVGMSRMGVAMAIEAAHLAHYPNFIGHAERKTRITLIDPKCHTELKYFQGRFKELFSVSQWREIREGDASKRLFDDKGWHNEALLGRNHHLGDDFIDVEWEFVERGIEDGDVHEYLRRIAEDPFKRLTVAICLPDDNRSVAAALYLPEAVYEKAIQVLVYQHHDASIIDSLAVNNRMNRYYRKLKAFGMVKNAYDDRLILTQEHIAGILSREYGKMYDTVIRQKNIRTEPVEPTRGKSRLAKYWSDVNNANTLWSKLRSAGYRGEGPIPEESVRLLAITEHNRWVVEQLLMRYRPLTPDEQRRAMQDRRVKEELKGCRMAHLDICSYDRLLEVDPELTHFDTGFIRIIPDILKSISENRS